MTLAFSLALSETLNSRKPSFLHMRCTYRQFYRFQVSTDRERRKPSLDVYTGGK